MVFRDPPSHTRLRKVLSPYLTREAVERLAPDIEDIANTLIDGFQDNEELELMASYANILPAEVLRRLLGFSSGHEEVIQQASNDISRAIDCVITEESIAGGARGMRAMVAVISEEIAAHRKGGCSGLLASLLKHCDQDKVIDETELIGMVMLLLFAGFETSSLLIGHGVYQLLHDSEQLSLLLKEPPLARSATDEAMRIGSPGQLIGRTVLEDCELGGKQLKKGDDMMFVLASANRDLVIHDRPNQFDIRRKVSMQAGFGFGIHFCIGATLARLEARIALQTLVRRLPHLALDDKGVKWTERIAIYGPQALHLRTNTARRGERQ